MNRWAPTTWITCERCRRSALELNGDDHWLSSASTRTQVLQEIETFLAKNLR